VRWLFLLLVISNLALAGWLYWRDDAPRPMTAIPSKIPGKVRLQLLSELPPNSLEPTPHFETAAEMPPPSLTTDTASVEQPVISSTASLSGDSSGQEQVGRCVRISSLAREDDLDALIPKLAAIKPVVIDSGEEFTERQTYWVMIPPYKTNSAARDAASKLAKAKVRDFLVIRSGEFKDGISLGLFSQKDGAESRLKEILALKLNIRSPEIRPRTSSARSHWLIVRTNSDDAQNVLQQQLSVEGMQGTPIDCPSITH